MAVFLAHPGTAILLAGAEGDAAGLVACGIRPNEAAQALYRRVGLTEDSLELSRHSRQRTDTEPCRPGGHLAATDGREA